MDLKSKRFWISIISIILIAALAMFIPDGQATVTAISNIGIIISVYIGGESARHAVLANKKVN